MKLIKNWEELAQIPQNDKYKILVNFEKHYGWIVPINDYLDDGLEIVCKCENISRDEYWKNHVYLSTHTFYGKHYKESTKILKKYGFDIEIDNWDKEVIEDE